jgi:DNA-binding winged helix-turn-helix (wHTH) protein
MQLLICIARAEGELVSRDALMDEIWPRIGGSAPFYQITERLNLPLVFNGPGSG